jgi:hypothetical protein
MPIPHSQLREEQRRLDQTLRSPNLTIDKLKTPKEIVDAGVKRWIKPTPEVKFKPEPRQPFFTRLGRVLRGKPVSRGLQPTTVIPDPTLNDDKFKQLVNKHNPPGFTDTDHHTHFHNLAAVLAGQKPAAIVSKAFLDTHPIGKELKSRAAYLGYGSAPINSKSGGSYIIGRHENVNHIKNALLNGDQDQVERGLGYPESQVSKPRTEEEKRLPF